MHSEIKKILEESQQNKRGVTVYFNGNTVGGAVTRISDEAVELKNQSSTRIVVLLKSIEAVVLS